MVKVKVKLVNNLSLIYTAAPKQLLSNTYV